MIIRVSSDWGSATEYEAKEGTVNQSDVGVSFVNVKTGKREFIADSIGVDINIRKKNYSSWLDFPY